MINLPLANVLITFIGIVWLIVALLLIGIILIQKGKGGGLGGAFGGAGGGGGLLGTKTGDFLTWVTIGLVFLFFFLAIILVKYGKLSAPEGLEDLPPATNQSAPAIPDETGNAMPVTPDTTDDEPAPIGNTEDTPE
ncbi:MAG: preprotein translocase subunit SecG [Phycisphaerae bacterium]|nr:preprotein translocase subunit SecG [Phycisphaerae bacterium]